MINKKLALTFLKNFLMAGLTIGLYSVIMEISTPEFVGFIHGALPITLTYLLVLTYFNDKNRVTNFVYITGLSSLLWISFLLILYILLRNGQSLSVSYGLTLVLFIILCFIFYNIFKKDFRK